MYIFFFILFVFITINCAFFTSLYTRVQGPLQIINWIVKTKLKQQRKRKKTNLMFFFSFHVQIKQKSLNNIL